MKIAAQIAGEVLAKLAAKAPKEPAIFEAPKRGFGPPAKKGPENKDRLKKPTEENIHARKVAQTFEEENMTTALENAMTLEQNKIAAENKNLTPMEQGYYDALAKLGYARGASEGTSLKGGYAERIKAAAGLPPAAKELKHPTMTRPDPKKSGPLMPGLPGKAPVAPPLGGRKSFTPSIRPSATRGQ